MELLASLFSPIQLGHIRDVTKSVSLEDVAEVATSSFRSMGTTREDSLVFVLGLLNLGTVLCYAIYSQIFKPTRRGSSAMDENHFVMKKIQTILDELVLHVHTTTYYRSSLERNQELGKEFTSKRETSVQPRSSSDSSSIRSLFTIFDWPESAAYGEKEPPSIEQFESKRSSEDYDNYLQREAKKMIQEWLSFLVQSTTNPFNSRTKRHTMMPFPNAFRRNATGRRRPWSPSIKKRIGTTMSTMAPISTWKPPSRALSKSSPTTTTTAEPQPEWTLNHEAMSQLRRPQMKRLVAAATGAEADGRLLAAAQAAVSAARSTSGGPDVSHPTHQEDVPVLPVLALFPHSTVSARAASSGQFKSERATSSRSGLRLKNGSTEKPEDKSTTQPTTTTTTTTTTTAKTTTTTEEIKSQQSEPRHIPSEFRQQMYSRNAMMESDSPYDLEDSASDVHPTEEDGLIVRFMRLIQQTTPLAMDVLDVYKSRSIAKNSPQSSEPKCLERLLCQLNQDWKGRGSVPAAMAPFLSIAMGWLMDRSTTPNLSHILMAVRAGWIGKQCASLYPRCSNPGRPQWTVAPLHDDSLNLPSIGQPPVKVRPPLDFFAFTPTPPSTTLLDSTLRPPSSSVRAIPSVKPKVPHPSESSDLRTTTSSSTANKKTSSTTDWVRESVQSDTNAVWDKHSIELGEEEQTTSALLGTSLQVDRNGEAGAPVSNGPAGSVKPWGKPSRFSGADEIELSDIVRGVYSTTTEKDHQLDEEEDEEYDGEEEEEEEEEEEDTEENEEDPNPSTKKPAAHYQEDSILHDLNRNHFVEKPASESPAKIKDTYEEIQKKKTHRLEMVPNRSLVHPWLSEPVWVPENTWPTKTDGNRLRSDEENEDSGDRHRDRVSFGHEDAVKDVRLFDFAMQYLRDRSA